MKIKYLFLFVGFFELSVQGRSKILHLTFHKGCLNEFQRVAEIFDIELTSIMVPDMPSKWLDGQTTGNNIYNITHRYAQDAWDLHKVFFNQFDAIVTSDTGPLARIFLQNNCKKPLIIWVCNRFDYGDQASAQGKFPDKEYYELFKQATTNPLIKIISYTPFEYFYAGRKGIHIGTYTIKPCTLPAENLFESLVPRKINKASTFFIPPYHNDTHFMDLSKKCSELGIENFRGRYNGPQDLKDFKGIIHIPYALSNLALFENIQYGLIYFIPSKKFVKKLAQKTNFWFQDWHMNSLDYSEWYLEENAPLFVYFESWQDLKNKVKTLDYEKKREEILKFARNHTINVSSTNL
ncbi:MAG: hypothetical protein K2X90_02660 [Candidatus Babeliaceae bacterium]|nr:hypothetical protein [Candidatus Babeliaceae bacterium]